MIYSILSYALLAIYIFLGLYFNYMLIREDIRSERKRKAKKKEQKEQSATLQRSR